MTDRKVAPNIWQTAFGWRVCVSGFDPATGTSRLMRKRFPPHWTVPELEEYRDSAQLEARRLRRQWRERPTMSEAPAAASFAEDVRRYLALEQTQKMPSVSSRTIEINKWIPIFRDRLRATIKATEITVALEQFRIEGYSNSYVNKFRTALMSLWTQLDGRSAVNPVKDTPVYEEAPLQARGVSLTVLERLLDLIPDDGVIERTHLYDEVWKEPLTTVAPRYKLSASYLKRVCRELDVPTPPRGYWSVIGVRRIPRPPLPVRAGSPIQRVSQAAKDRARLEILAWTGMEPEQLQRLGYEEFSIPERWYITPARRKGSRRRKTPRAIIKKPMNDELVGAFTRYVALGLVRQRFDLSALRRTWNRAQAALQAELRRETGDAHLVLRHVRLKDIRHTFGHAAFERFASTMGERGALELVGQLLDHAPGSPMTLRYALGAVPVVLRSRVAQFPSREPSKRSQRKDPSA